MPIETQDTINEKVLVTFEQIRKALWEQDAHDKRVTVICELMMKRITELERKVVLIYTIAQKLDKLEEMHENRIKDLEQLHWIPQ